MIFVSGRGIASSQYMLKIGTVLKEPVIALMNSSVRLFRVAMVSDGTAT